MTQQGTCWDPEIIAFCCDYCASSAAALAGTQRIRHPAGVKIIATPCTGKLETELILDAFEKGVDGILIAGCLEGGCHFVEGNLRARSRTDHIRSILEEIGLRAERLKMVNVSDTMASEFVKHLQEAVETIRALGPNPLRKPKKAQKDYDCRITQIDNRAERHNRGT